MSKENFYHRYRNNKISKKRAEAWRAKINASNSSYSVKENQDLKDDVAASQLSQKPFKKPRVTNSVPNMPKNKIGKVKSILLLFIFTIYLFTSISFLAFWYPSSTTNSSLFLFITLVVIQLLLIIYLISVREYLSSMLKKGLPIITIILVITYLAGSFSQVSINNQVYLSTSHKAKLFKEAKTMLISLQILESRDSFLNNDITYISNNNIELLKMITDDASISAYWTDKRKYTSTNTENAALLLAKAANNQKLAMEQIENELNQHDPANIPLANKYEDEARKQYLQAANLVGLEVGKYKIPLKDLEVPN